MNQGVFGTSLAELIGAAARKRTGVPPEIAAFLALEVAEGLSTKPAVVETTDVMVTDDGQVAVFPKASSAPEAQAARAVGAILARILMGGTSVVPPALNALVNRATDGQRGYGDLATLRKDLEAVLIPLNRGAARRVLARFVREVLRQPTPVHSAQPIPIDPREGATDAVDELLSALEGGAEKTGVMPQPYGSSPLPTPLPPTPQRPEPARAAAPPPDVPTTIATPGSRGHYSTQQLFGSLAPPPSAIVSAWDPAPLIAPSREPTGEISGSQVLDVQDASPELGDDIVTSPRHAAPVPSGPSAGAAAVAAALGGAVSSVPMRAPAAAPAEPFVFDEPDSAPPAGLRAAAPAKPMGFEGSIAMDLDALGPPAPTPGSPASEAGWGGAPGSPPSEAGWGGASAAGPTPPQGLRVAAPAKPLGLEGSVAMSLDELAPPVTTGAAGPTPPQGLRAAAPAKPLGFEGSVAVTLDELHRTAPPGAAAAVFSLFDGEESDSGMPQPPVPQMPGAPPPMGAPSATRQTKGTILASVAPPPMDVGPSLPPRPRESRISAMPPMPGIIPDAPMEEPASDDGKRWLGPLVMATLLLALTFAGIAVWKPELLGLGQRPKKREHVPPPAEVMTGILSVSSTPPGADVFLLVGRSPAEVRPVATGGALEFLAIQKGTVPRREVLLANAVWLDAPTGPGNTTKKIELRIQLEALPEGAPPAPVPPAALPPQRDPPGDTPRGVVTVRTEPAGGSVYLRLGVTPTGPMRDVRLMDSMTLLVVRPDHELETISLKREDFARAAGAPVERSVTLTPLPGASADGGVPAAPATGPTQAAPPPPAPAPAAAPPAPAQARPERPARPSRPPAPAVERPARPARPAPERPPRPPRPPRPTKELPSNPYQ
jgi:hypothetical protein